MKQKPFYVICACVVLLLSITSACSSIKTVQLTATDNNSEIKIKKGDLITVKLAGNVTTGYQWEWLSDEAALLEENGDPDYKVDNNLIGAGGMYTFSFTADQSGEGTLHLIYHRSFETGVAPIQEFSVKITVE
jgi:inhibitor of cysteine peptidase